jgi:TonB-dependent SusC/RagA subfamily outer membrane receptor
MSRPWVHSMMLAVVAAATSACGSSGGASTPSTAPAPDASKRNTVGSDAISNSAGEPIEKVLAGRVAGVQLGRASDGSLTVQIRGATSWNSDNQPLYIIDGVPITPGPNGALSGINPYDIEKIEVLKDPAKTAMYGSRGANGVILIKTKKP